MASHSIQGHSVLGRYSRLLLILFASQFIPASAYGVYTTVVVSTIVQSASVSTFEWITPDYSQTISSLKSYCRAVFTGCSGGFSNLDCVSSWCLNPGPLTAAEIPCDQNCCYKPGWVGGGTPESLYSAQACLLQHSSKGYSTAPAVVLGTDPAYSGCISWMANGIAAYSANNYWFTGDYCWRGPGTYGGNEYNSMLSTCKDFWTSFMPSDTWQTGLMNYSHCPETSSLTSTPRASTQPGTTFVQTSKVTSYDTTNGAGLMYPFVIPPQTAGSSSSATDSQTGSSAAPASTASQHSSPTSTTVSAASSLIVDNNTSLQIATCLVLLIAYLVS